MNLVKLSALVALADTGSFSAAGEKLHTVQSNVSTHVARLERDLGAVLWDRAGSRLTEEGELVVARARRAQSELSAIDSDLDALHHDIGGTVRLGVIGTTARLLVMALVEALRQAHPRVRLVVTEGVSNSLIPLLVSGRLDEAVVNLPVNETAVATTRLFDEDLLLVAPENHPLARRDQVAFEDLADVDLLMPAPGTALRAELDTAAAASATQLRPLIEVDGLRLLASLAFGGHGPAILPATAAPAWLDGPWRRVPVTGLSRRQVAMARPRRGLPSAPIRAVRAVLEGVVAAHIGTQPGMHPPAGS